MCYIESMSFVHSELDCVMPSRQKFWLSANRSSRSSSLQAEVAKRSAGQWGTAQRRTSQGTGRGSVATGTPQLSGRELRAWGGAVRAGLALALAQRVQSAQGVRDTTKSIEGQLTAGFALVAAGRGNGSRVANNHTQSRNVADLGRAAVLEGDVVDLYSQSVDVAENAIV